MKAKIIVLLVICLCSIFLSGNALSQDNDYSHKLLYENKCSRCHGLDEVTNAVKSPEQWESTVEDMRKKDTDWISKDEAKVISTYLGTNLSIKNEKEDSEHVYLPVSSQELLGFITFALLFITVALGFTMTHGKRKLFKIHKIFAYITLVSAVVHGTLIFINHYL